jgi:hypothetical protein
MCTNNKSPKILLGLGRSKKKLLPYTIFVGCMIIGITLVSTFFPIIENDRNNNDKTVNLSTTTNRMKKHDWSCTEWFHPAKRVDGGNDNRPGLSPQYPLVFIHIPKTAGTTIKDALTEWHHTNQIKTDLCIEMGDFPGYQNGYCPQKCIYPHTSIFSGHCGYGWCNEYAEQFIRDAFIFAVLRKPIERMISYIDMMLDPTRRFYNIGVSKLFVEWTANGTMNVDELLSNLNDDDRVQTSLDRIILKDLRRMGKFQASMLCHYNRTYTFKDMTDKQLLDCAIKNMSRLDAIGITEYLDELLPFLRIRLGDLIPKSFKSWPRRNSARNQKTILSTQSRKILKYFSQVDMEVYEYGEKLAAKQTALMKTCLGRSSSSSSIDDK